MPLTPELRRLVSLQTLIDFAAELELELERPDLDVVARESATYHLKIARQAIDALEQPGDISPPALTPEGAPDDSQA